MKGAREKVVRTQAGQRTQATAEPITFTPSSPAYFPPARITQHVHCTTDHVACIGREMRDAQHLRPLPVRQGPPLNLALRDGTRTSNVPAVHVDSRTAAVCGAQLEHDCKYHTPAIPWPRRNLCAQPGSAAAYQSDYSVVIKDASCFRPKQKDTWHASFTWY